MTLAWPQLNASLRAHRPAVLADLNPPASTKTLQHLQSTLGASLPEVFLGALRGHDGQRGNSEPLLDSFQWLSCGRMLDAWRFWVQQSASAGFNEGAEPGTGVQAYWWHPGWIPFAGNGNGDYLCLDLAPARAGLPGQVIMVWHDDGARRRVSEQFPAWFARFF